MPRLPWVRATLCAALLSLLSIAPSYADPLSTFVTSCGTISNPGGYIVMNDLSASGSDCITVQASNVSLILAGHTISGSGSNNGVTVGGSLSSVTIQAGTIQSFAKGIASSANGSTVQGVTLQNDGVGIELDSVNGGAIQGNHLSGSGTLIQLNGSQNVDVAGNTTDSGSQRGIVLSNSSTQNRVQGNVIGQASQAGIEVGNGTPGTPSPSQCSSSSSSPNNTLQGNVIATTALGIYLECGNGVNELLQGNVSSGGNPNDLFDANSSCDSNTWQGNVGSGNQGCVK